MTTFDEAKIRFEEICKQIQELNLEAEKLLMEHSGDAPKGYGHCYHSGCWCVGYVHSDTPGVCGRSNCGHLASWHSF